MTIERKTRRLACSLAITGWVMLCGYGLWAQTVSSTTGAAALPPTAEAAMGGTTGETKVFPLSQIRRGLQGVAYTVFEGVNPEPMQVEILGVLKDSLGPGRDMILARLKGTKPEFTGVVAGMSGSPVYIDGRLVGALSYRIGQFSKEPIAGITPIEQMLEVRDDEVRPAAARGVQPSLADEAAVQPGAGSLPKVNAGSGMELQAMETPLVFSGFSQDAVDLFGDRFRAMGMTPVAGLGSADANAVQPEPLVPGSAVSAVLVRGDLSISGTCTVTYVDPKRLLACGHPITQYGPVDLPMTKAAVVATLPSPLNAFKIINTTETVGAFTEDRASAIMGRFGEKARMIPVTVEVAQPAVPGVTTAAKNKTFHFEVLDNRQLTPSAMLVSVYQSLQGTNAAAAEMSYRLSGQIGVEGLPAVQMDGIMAQNALNPAAINTALFVNDRFSRVYDNPLDQPVVTGVKLRMEGIPERKTAVLESARLETLEARPGDTIEAEVTLRPYQAESRVMRLKVKLPPDLTPGQVRVLVSDGTTVDRLLSAGAPPQQHAVGLAAAIDQMNRLHENDRVYVTLLNREAQAVVEGQTLPGVPLSMANVLGPLKDSQRLQLNGESVVEAGSAEAGYAVSGSQVLNLTVR